MKVPRLRYMLIAPALTLMALGLYASSVITEPTISPQANSVWLTCLGLANVLAFGAVGLALLAKETQALRLEVEALRWRQPAAMPLPQVQVAGGTVYGALDGPTQPVQMVPRHRGRRRRGRRDPEPPSGSLKLVPMAPDLRRINGSN